MKKSDSSYATSFEHNSKSLPSPFEEGLYLPVNKSGSCELTCLPSLTVWSLQAILNCIETMSNVFPNRSQAALNLYLI